MLRDVVVMAIQKDVRMYVFEFACFYVVMKFTDLLSSAVTKESNAFSLKVSVVVPGSESGKCQVRQWRRCHRSTIAI